MNPIGVMQGRMITPIAGRIQAFPVDGWRVEFDRARAAGLDCIEWIYDAGTELRNPLHTSAGVGQIRAATAATGVEVRSVCADYFMVQRLVSAAGAIDAAALAVLEPLLDRAAELGCRYIVLPFVDSSSLRSSPEQAGLHRLLDQVLPKAAAVGVELHLETDFPPQVLADVLARWASPHLRANYDIGNSASLGHDPSVELTLLGPWLGSVHVKDRVRGGGTVPLGTGSADFATCFRLIRRAGFRGPYILQVARHPDLEEVEWARQNRRFVECWLARPLEEVSP